MCIRDSRIAIRVSEGWIIRRNWRLPVSYTHLIFNIFSFIYITYSGWKIVCFNYTYFPFSCLSVMGDDTCNLPTKPICCFHAKQLLLCHLDTVAFAAPYACLLYTSLSGSIFADTCRGRRKDLDIEKELWPLIEQNKSSNSEQK